MRWRNLSPRFHVEPINFHKPTAEKMQHPPHSEPNGESISSREAPDSKSEADSHLVDSSVRSSAGGEVPFPSEEPITSSEGHLLLATTKEVPQHTNHSAAHRATTPLAAMVERQPKDTTSDIFSNTLRSGETSGASRAAGQADLSDSKENNPLMLSEGCPAHSTDMGFFKKLGVPHGRLTLHGPSQSSGAAAGYGNAVSEAEGGSWRPEIIGTEVKCPPLVHPDTCGLTATFNRHYETPWVWILERDKSQTPKNKADSLEFADVVWIFRGTFVSKLWLINGMGVAVPYRPLSKHGRFHYGIAYLFDKAVRPMIEQHLAQLEHRIAGRKTPYVMVFSGHSLGAALAQLSAWYFAKRTKSMLDEGLLQIRTVAFGCPSWGDTKSYEEMQASGVKAQELNMDIDPVGSLFGEEALTKLSNKKPFLMELFIEDMDKVEVASSVPGDPPFSGRFWTRTSYRPVPLLSRLAATVFNLEDVDMVLLDPVLAHFTSYTAVFTIMAGLLEQASFGSGVAAPFVSNTSAIVGHPWNAAFKAAQEVLKKVLHRIEADRLNE